MAQLHIVPKRVNPLKASQTGYDEAVCGNCPLRHSKGGACYVNIGHGPMAVWKAHKRGAYGKNLELKPDRAFRRQRVRLGAYGDPTALPLATVKAIAGMFAGHTGYTHQWRTCDQGFRKLLMASADSENDKDDANAMGWRTFRVVDDYGTLAKGERVCANDSHGIQCADCMACHGKGGRADIAIKVHGTWKGRFQAGPVEAEAGAVAAG